MDEQSQTTVAETEASEKTISSQTDLTALNQYLTASCCTLLGVNIDKFHRALHDLRNQEVLAQYVSDKNQRTLLVARIDLRAKAAQDFEDHDGKEGESVAQADKSKGAEAGEVLQGEEIRFSLRVQYMGTIAHTLAFLKRE